MDHLSADLLCKNLPGDKEETQVYKCLHYSEKMTKKERKKTKAAALISHVNFL